MTVPPELADRFRADLARLWPHTGGSDARLGLAVSGGPDSLALLLLGQAVMPGRVEAATVDHRLRPDSASEAEMVAQICGDLGVPHDVLPVTVPPGNLQRNARISRYTALLDWCKRRDLRALATGHQLDDQAETLVMRLNRGSGLAGLAGVRALGTVLGSDLPLVRPLLGWRRIELATLVADAGIVAACDPSNKDDRFDRVRIRQALADAAWIDPVGLAQSADHLGDALAYLEDTLVVSWAHRVSRDGDAVRFVPGPSDFEAGEIARRIVSVLGTEVSRSDSATLVARLRRGDNASLGGVLVRAMNDDWVFAAEPARRIEGQSSRKRP